jgi:DNA replication protein DnaC
MRQLSPELLVTAKTRWSGAAKENVALVGPAGTGKSHTLIALGHAAVLAGHRVGYLTAADLVDAIPRHGRQQRRPDH